MTKMKLVPIDPPPEMVSVAQYVCSLSPGGIATFCLLCAELLVDRSTQKREGQQSRRDRFRYHARSFEVLAEAFQTTAAMPRE